MYVVWEGEALVSISCKPSIFSVILNRTTVLANTLRCHEASTFLCEAIYVSSVSYYL